MPSSSIGAVDFFPRSDFSDREIAVFDCGKEQLNSWLKQYSRSSQKKGITTMIMVPQGQKSPVLGYATVCASSIEKEKLPEQRQSGLGNYPVPVFLIARLAISVHHQKMGLGRRLLMRIYKNAYDSISTGVLGARGIIVDAKDDDAVQFYKLYDLEVLDVQESFPKRMFIAYETIQQLFAHKSK